jgi:hypothetical protein
MHSASWGVGGVVAPVAGTLLLGLGNNLLWWACGGLAVVLAVGYRWFGQALRAQARASGPEVATG